MKVLLRADASPTQGTGHVMRCLTLSEELIRRGHEVVLLTNMSGVAWLERKIESVGLPTFFVSQHSLDLDVVVGHDADVIVVDSYEIEAERVSELRAHTRVMAIVDGSTRGIEADLYLDHNLGAEQNDWPESVSVKMLAGSEYALIRDGILEQKRDEPWRVRDGVLNIVAFMGGSDPKGVIVDVSRAFLEVGHEFEVTLVVGQQWRDEVARFLVDHPTISVIEPTTELPTLLGEANVVVAAAGSSAWELCTLGIPSLLIATVDNHLQSFERLEAAELILGLNLFHDENVDVTQEVERGVKVLSASERLRQQLSTRCAELFDGMGKERVVREIEKLIAQTDRGR